jgi:hypothetical protein
MKTQKSKPVTLAHIMHAVVACKGARDPSRHFYLLQLLLTRENRMATVAGESQGLVGVFEEGTAFSFV